MCRFVSWTCGCPLYSCTDSSHVHVVARVSHVPSVPMAFYVWSMFCKKRVALQSKTSSRLMWSSTVWSHSLLVPLMRIFNSWVQVVIQSRRSLRSWKIWLVGFQHHSSSGHLGNRVNSCQAGDKFEITTDGAEVCYACTLSWSTLNVTVMMNQGVQQKALRGWDHHALWKLTAASPLSPVCWVVIGVLTHVQIRLMYRWFSAFLMCRIVSCTCVSPRFSCAGGRCFSCAGGRCFSCAVVSHVQMFLMCRCAVWYVVADGLKCRINIFLYMAFFFCKSNLLSVCASRHWNI